MSPNEARKRYYDLGPATGGDTPYLQVQNYSLEALNRRDTTEPPPTSPQPSGAPGGTPPMMDGETVDEEPPTKGLVLSVWRPLLDEYEKAFHP